MHLIFLELKVEGKVLPEYDNKPFVNLVIPIQDSIQTTRKFIPSEIMRYIRSATNSKTMMLKCQYINGCNS